MRVMGIILFEFLFGYVMQAFTLILGLYAFNKQKIELKKYLIASIVMMFVVFITKFLPINNGVNTVLDIIAALLIGLFYLKLSALFTARSTVVLTLLIFLIEFVYTYAVISVIGQGKFADLMNDDLYKYLLGFPTSLFYTIIITLYYFFVINKQKIPIDSFVKKRCGDEDT